MDRLGRCVLQAEGGLTEAGDAAGRRAAEPEAFRGESDEVLVDTPIGVLIVEDSHAVATLTQPGEARDHGAAVCLHLTCGEKASRFQPIGLVVEGNEHDTAITAYGGDGNVETWC